MIHEPLLAGQCPIDIADAAFLLLVQSSRLCVCLYTISYIRLHTAQPDVHVPFRCNSGVAKVPICYVLCSVSPSFSDFIYSARRAAKSDTIFSCLASSLAAIQDWHKHKFLKTKMPLLVRRIYNRMLGTFSYVRTYVCMYE